MSIGETSGPSTGSHPSNGGGDTYNDDDAVTHARGRIDDMVRHLAGIRERVTPDNVADLAGRLDDADEIVESIYSDSIEAALNTPQGEG